MNKLITTIALVLAVCFGVAFNVTSVEAAVTNPVAGVVKCTATGDTIDTELPYGAKIVGVKVNPGYTGKYYRLRHTNASGAIIFETTSYAALNANAVAVIPLETPMFIKPSAGLYYQTDDPSTTASITIYTER